MVVYALYNRERGKIYIGHTDNLIKRVLRHNKLLPSKSTGYTSRNKGIWEIVYQEECENRTKARQREKELKSAQGRKFVRGIIQDKDIRP